MKFYTLDTEFAFGEFKGNTVRQTIEIQPTYLDWCTLNLDHFYISDEVIEEIKSTKPEFKLSDEGIKKLNEKYEIWKNEQEQGDNDEYDDYHRRESYGEYAGSYAQDEVGLSDDFINDVLDGDPDLYWNID